MTALGLQHEGVLYQTPEDFVVTVAAPLRAAVEDGQAVFAFVESETGRLLRDHLGAAGEQVDVEDPTLVPWKSGQDLIAHRCRLVGTLTTAGRATVLGEYPAWPSAADMALWCAVVNTALVDVPLTLICGRPTSALDTGLIGDLHPVLGERDGNPTAPDVTAVLEAHPPAPPAPLGPPAAEVPFIGATLRPVRRVVAEHASASGLAPDQVYEAVIAVNELVTNSVEHGPGHGLVRLWPGLTCEVHDPGRLGPSLLGLAPPPPQQQRGRGLWLVRQLCDTLHIWTDADGTGARFSIAPRP